MKIAIEGCCHGELDKIYSTIEHIENENQIKIDLLIICGDFQSIRNKKDLESMAVPDKYRKMCSFWKYYAGVKKAPVLTLFIGGNHESSSYLSELPYGGWVAPNIYYLGYAGVVNFAGLRIAGLSGIYKPHDFYKGHYEMPPFTPGSLHSIYHVRNLEVFRLSQLKRPVDIMLTHDWPLGVYNHGDVSELLRFKPYLADEVHSNTLGSPENEKLLKLIKPKYWFSAHLHVKFSCLYKHDDNQHVTKFLSLDKCLPRRKFLQIIDIQTDIMNKSLSLDPEWLCILKKTDHLLSVDSYNQAPIAQSQNVSIADKDLEEIREDFQDFFEIPDNFKQTAPPFSNPEEQEEDTEIAKKEENALHKDIYLNEQTTLLCEMLNIRDPVRILLDKKGKSSLINESTTQLYNNLLDDSD